MNNETQKNKGLLTDKDLVETLLLISETSKTLALEVMLYPKEDKGGKKNVRETIQSKQK